MSMLPYYFVKIFGTRNCHVYENSETILQERLKLSCKIQPLKYSRWKSTIWRCEHYSINWQKYLQCPYCTAHRMINYTHLHHQPHRKLLLLTVVNMQSTFLPAICCQMFTDLKNVFTGRLSIKFVKIWLLKISPFLKCVTTLSFARFIVNHDISLRMSLDFGYYKVV